MDIQPSLLPHFQLHPFFILVLKNVYHTTYFQASKLVLLPEMLFPSLPGQLLCTLQNPMSMTVPLGGLVV